MLIGLSVRDIVLIEKLDLAVEPGLTALTGETGAGKSILLDALGLAAGGKADRALVRSGADRGVVAAEFRAAKRHPVWNALAENGLSSADGASDGYVILRREQRADGATRAFVNDEPVSVGLLRRIGDSLIETHGQNDGHGFLRTEAHRAMLDAFASASALKEETAVAAARLGAAEEALAAWRARQADSAQEAAYLSEIVKDLSALAPEEGEEARLAAERAALMSVERIAGDVSDAADALAADSGVEARLAGALKRLEAALGKLEGDAADGGGPLGAALGAGVASLDRALLEAQEAREALERLAAAVDADPAALETTEARLFALRAAARKYATSADRLPALRAEAAEKLAGLEDAATGEATLLAETKAAARAYDEATERLTERRAAAAKRLDAAVARQLKPLKLGKAAFKTSVETDPERISRDGRDQVQFLISTNPGAALGPLSQIASGGELSRFVLALKAALAAKERKTVVIFDEVDAGVGGAVADAVGERLARLAEDGQVLVVTHSPQVAARAGAHLRIEKTSGKKTRTRVAALDAKARLEEIARMLSGAKITDEARAAAAKLLAAAGDAPLKKSA